MPPEERILVIRGGAVGDFVLTLPLLAALRRTRPEAEIEILGYPAIAELAVGRRLAHAASRVDAADLAPLFSQGGALSVARRAWLAGFALVVCVWPDRDGVMQANLGRAGVRELVMIDPLPPEGKGVHAVEHVAAQLRAAGMDAASETPRVSLTERDTWWAETFLRVTGAGAAPLLAMHVGSGSVKKNWPAERFIETARAWLREKAGGVLLTEGPAERERSDEVARFLPKDRTWKLCCETLPRVAAVLDRCDAYVGNDSGITHLAAAVGTPTVAIFGPSDPALWAPRGGRVAVVAPEPSGEFAGVREVLSALRQVAAT